MVVAGAGVGSNGINSHKYGLVMTRWSVVRWRSTASQIQSKRMEFVCPSTTLPLLAVWLAPTAILMATATYSLQLLIETDILVFVSMAIISWSPCTSSSAPIGDLAVCPPEFLIVRNSSSDFERRLKISQELFRIVALFI